LRPITVTAGPLVAASANNICLSQTPAAGTTFVLSGSLATNVFQGTGSIAGGVLTITAVTTGVLTGSAPLKGTALSGVGVLANTFVAIPQVWNVNTIGAYNLNIAQTVSSTTIYGGAVATLDTPRRLLFTPAGNESANTFTIVGTDGTGSPITEVLTGANAVAFYSAMDYKTVTQISPTNTPAGAITVGTTTIASTPWVRLDEYAPFPTAIQVTVTGVVSYTVQQTLQDASSPFNAPISPYQMVWINSTDPTVVASSTSAQSSYTYAPLYARVTLNSGTGSISAVFSQNASSSF